MIRLTRKNDYTGIYEFDTNVIAINGWTKQDVINYISGLEDMRDQKYADLERSRIELEKQMNQVEKIREAFIRGSYHNRASYYAENMFSKNCCI